MGSLQCLLVTLSGLLEGLIIWVFPPSGPRLGFCSSSLYILFGCDGVALPMQVVSQREQDVPDCLFSPLGPTRWWTGWPSQQVYTMVEVSDLLVGGPISYKFYGGYICLWVALVGSASDLIEWTSPPPSAPVQQHAETYFGGWQTDVDLLSPMWGIHPRTIWHRASIPPP